MKVVKISGLVLLLVLSTEVARSQGSPYSGFEARSIKALSSEQQTALLEGQGMGFALAAELNHFPGPLHVLELADELGLSEDQLERTETVFELMRASARQLGGSMIELEARLDRHFAERSINREILNGLTAEIATIRGQLRATHLAAHLEMIEILDRHQVHRYRALRGYDGEEKDHDLSRHHCR